MLGCVCVVVVEEEEEEGTGAVLSRRRCSVGSVGETEVVKKAVQFICPLHCPFSCSMVYYRGNAVTVWVRKTMSAHKLT